MDYKELLVEQIKLAYPESEIVSNVQNRDEIKIINFPFDGIEIEITGRFDIHFRQFDLIDFKALSTYLKPRLKFEDIRIFYNAKQLNIYLDRKFTKSSKGNFEKAMWTFLVIEYFVSEIKRIIYKLNETGK